MIVPLLGSMTPAINLSSVVFPAPLPPTNPMTWPDLISKSTWVNASTSLKLLPTPTRESSVSLISINSVTVPTHLISALILLALHLYSLDVQMRLVHHVRHFEAHYLSSQPRFL